MNARERALDRFCFEMDEYIRRIELEEGLGYADAVDFALEDLNEYWQALFQEELEEEDLTAGES